MARNQANLVDRLQIWRASDSGLNNILYTNTHVLRTTLRGVRAVPIAAEKYGGNDIYVNISYDM